MIGRYGNPYNDYISGFDVKLNNDGLNIVPVRATGPAPFSIQPNDKYTAGQSGYQTRKGYQQSGFLAPSAALTPSRSNGTQAQYRAESDEEGFLDIMKSALRVGAPLLGGALKTGLPLALGPLGAPIGALAGLALNAAGKLAESTDAESFDPSEAQEGTMERAILAEAALTALQKIDLHPDDQESIFSDMKDYVMKAAPTVKKVAPRVMGAMMEPALRIALNSLHNYNEKGHSGAEAFEDQSSEPFRLTVPYSSAIDQKGDRNAEAFLQGLRNSMQQGQEAFDGESEEGFFDALKAGAQWEANLVYGAFGGKSTRLGPPGLPTLAKMIGDRAESIEAESGAPSALSSSDLAKRALVGEAALQALMKLPPQKLEEEGFFDSIYDTFRKITPIVLKVAPAVISNLSPTVGGIIKAATGQEAVFADAPALRRRPLNGKRSVSNIRGRAGGNDLLTKVRDWHGGH